jgi:hypothetical protein
MGPYGYRKNPLFYADFKRGQYTVLSSKLIEKVKTEKQFSTKKITFNPNPHGYGI